MPLIPPPLSRLFSLEPAPPVGSPCPSVLPPLGRAAHLTVTVPVTTPLDRRDKVWGFLPTDRPLPPPKATSRDKGDLVGSCCSPHPNSHQGGTSIRSQLPVPSSHLPTAHLPTPATNYSSGTSTLEPQLDLTVTSNYERPRRRARDSFDSATERAAHGTSRRLHGCSSRPGLFLVTSCAPGLSWKATTKPGQGWVFKDAVALPRDRIPGRHLALRPVACRCCRSPLDPTLRQLVRLATRRRPRSCSLPSLSSCSHAPAATA